MKFKQAFSLCMALLLTATALFSCAKDGDDEHDTAVYEAETVLPVDAELQADYTSDPETVEYLNALGTTFENIPASAEEDFRYTTANGTATVTDYHGNATKVRVPDTLGGCTVTAIADAAFADKTDIKALYLPDSVGAVGKGILKGCSSLQALRTPLVGSSSEAYLGYLFGAERYADNARDVPASLLYLELGASLTELADYALFDCNDLELVRLPDTLTHVGAYALYNCSSLLAINTEQLVRVGEYAFEGCQELTRLEFGAALEELSLGALQGCGGLRTLAVPFVGGTPTEHTYLAYVFGAEVPDFAQSFYPPYLTAVKVGAGSTTLGNYAFYECLSISRVELDDAIVSIGTRAFSGCVRLTECTFPASLTAIRENAFYGCLSLKTLSLDQLSSLESIGINAFYRCEGLTEVTLPQSLKALPASCFADCFSLTTVDLGGVTEIGKNAFYRCNRLQ